MGSATLLCHASDPYLTPNRCLDLSLNAAGHEGSRANTNAPSTMTYSTTELDDSGWFVGVTRTLILFEG